MTDTASDLRRQCEMIARQIETGEYDFDPDCSDYEYPNACDYLSDALSIEYVVTANNEYNGAIVLVAFGGPNIWIDTRWNVVRGAWWGESCTVPYRNDALGLDEFLAEIRFC